MDSILAFLKRIIPTRIRAIFAPAYHFCLAFIGALAYGFPSRHLTVIGVTGTNGKTTVVHFLHEILYSSGFKVGSISSLRFKVNGSEKENRLKMTMPGRIRLQQFLAECRRAQCRFVVLEVTSEGIKQFRHKFIRFHSAVLTNITPEHIEAHGGFEQYRNAKLELFRALPKDGFAILNREDASSELIASVTRAEVVWYSPSVIELKRLGHPVHALSFERERIRFTVDEIFFDIPIGGSFNFMNSLAAIAAAFAYRISLDAAALRFKTIQAPAGRMEHLQRKPFSAVVDYAHTPDALEKVYGALAGGNSKAEDRNSGLICVFGSAGGGRDKWKRREMGAIAARTCREIILTSEDPDDEDPTNIAAEIRDGIPDAYAARARVVLDRREAIQTALRLAKAGDTVIITGMGAQPWFVSGGKKIPWDERRVVREELARLKSEAPS